MIKESFRSLLRAGLLATILVGGPLACSDSGGTGGPLGLETASPAEENTAATVELADDAERRLEAELQPVINVDASGKARSRDQAGTANDRFDAQVEIAKRHFGRLGIDAGDGFQDENVVLTVHRAGVLIFSTRMRFSENRPADITFETDISGPAAPEIQAGDVARVRVNGNATLRGTFRRV